MSANELLTLLTRVSFVLLGALTLIDFVRHRDQARLSITLMFNSLAVPVAIGALMRVAGVTGGLLSIVSSLAILAQPYLLLRVVERFRPVPLELRRGARVAMILSWVIVILIPPPLPGLLTMAVILYFVVVDGYAMVAFIRGAFAVAGVVRQRLRFAAIGSGLLALTLLVAGIAIVLPGLAMPIGSLVQLLAFLSAWSYYLSFVPPRWLHTTWQLAELRRFLLQNADKLSLEDQSQTLERLYHTAIQAVGAITATAALWNDAQAKLVLQPSSQYPALTGTVSETDGMIGRAWAECKLLFADATMSLGSAERRLMESVGARTMLIVPLEVTGHAWGLLLAFLQQPSLFIEDDLSLLSLFAEQTAIVFENSALMAAQQELLQQLSSHARQLEAANQELESFSYSVSHDLRAPLRAVDGFSRILLEEYAGQLPAEAVRYLQLVRNNAQQMGELIEGLLAFSRAGRQPLNKEPIVVAGLVKQVLAELRDEQKDRSVEVTIGDLPPCEADRMLLRQVLVNLLANALKFTRQCEVARIQVGFQVIEGEGVYFVKDNGAGFDMRYANKMFGVFQRLHRSDDYEGNGVGLAIVHNILQRHGGRIWVEAEVGKGATFFFTLGGNVSELEIPVPA